MSAREIALIMFASLLVTAIAACVGASLSAWLSGSLTGRFSACASRTQLCVQRGTLLALGLRTALDTQKRRRDAMQAAAASLPKWPFSKKVP
jgi:hypothetical protein